MVQQWLLYSSYDCFLMWMHRLYICIDIIYFHGDEILKLSFGMNEAQRPFSQIINLSDFCTVKKLQYDARLLNAKCKTDVIV